MKLSELKAWRYFSSLSSLSSLFLVQFCLTLPARRSGRKGETGGGTEKGIVMV